MRKIRIGKDIYFTWQILTNKEPVPLEGRDLKLMLKNPLGRFLDFHFEIYQGNKLKFTFHGTDHKHLGTYSLTLWENYGKEGQTAVDMCEAFRLVAPTCEEDSISVPNLEMATVNLGASSIDISLNSDMIVSTTNESCGCLLYQETPVHTVYAKQEERYEDHQTQRCGSAF